MKKKKVRKYVKTVAIAFLDGLLEERKRSKKRKKKAK